MLKDAEKATSGTLMSLLASDAGTPLPLHISLSAPLMLKTEQREAFLERVQKAVYTALRAERNTAGPLELRLATLKWAANFERSRWFLAVGVRKLENNVLNRLLHDCNSIAASLDLPALYAKRGKQDADPLPDADLDYSDRFHFSIAWTLDAPISARVVQDFVDLSAEQSAKLADIEIRVRSAKVKVGSNIHSIPFH